MLTSYSAHRCAIRTREYRSMGKYQTVKRGGRNRAVCEGCKVTVNRLMAYRTDMLAKACRDCATSEEMYGPPFGREVIA